MSLSVQNLCFSYERDTPILRNVSIEVAKGQFVGIFGPNGGGKTSLLQLLLGFLKPDSGTILYEGTISPKKMRVQMGYVPQMRRFDRQFPITVLEVIFHGCFAQHKGWGSFSSELEDQAYEALKLVKMEDKAREPFGTLSGGQVQRTLIARALVSHPKILLFDEATVGIDPDTLQEIFNLLLELKGSITILLVTHDLQVIANEMDQLLCINQDVTPYKAAEVCEHFTIGLYHPRKKRDD